MNYWLFSNFFDSEFLPPVDHWNFYFVYETVLTLFAFFINGIAFCTVGPRADDYSGFIVVLCSAMDMITLLMNLFSRVGDKPNGDFVLIDGSFFDTVLETHFTLLFLPVTLKLLLMVIHVFMQALYWFDTLRPQKFDSTTDMEEIYQSELWINIKIKLSMILLLQSSYPALLVAVPITIGSHYPLDVLKVGRIFNWMAPAIPVLSAFTLIMAVPVVRSSFLYPFRCRKRISPESVATGPVLSYSYALPI
ncbi:hypothetical protein M3Y97_00635700 [Aphelenchoides bicaudatus]|nr:hypothetical protein M3Y97_00635700 [Aphelenchoides bicaudatus]